jgi:pimeloyl-ACP methyl ester carboxylesterase
MPVNRKLLLGRWFGIFSVAAAIGFAALSAPRVALAAKDEPLADEETIDMTTSDGVKLRMSYYAGVEGEWETVPVIILHDFGGDRTQYVELALTLQKEGFAVLVPDLRGHGESTATTHTNPAGKPITIGARELNDPNQVKAMFQKDMAEIRSFLIKRNNAEELNIRRTCIIGVGAGAVLAVNYAAEDWRFPDRGPKPQGQDVRGIVMISPKKVANRLPMIPALDYVPRDPNFKTPLIANTKVSMLIIAGENDRRDFAEADAIQKLLTLRRPRDPAPKDKTVFLEPIATNLQREQLLGDPKLNVEPLIINFINDRLVELEDPDFKWKKR